MRNLIKFFTIMFSEWGSGLSGPLSVPFAIAALYVSPPVQRICYGSLAAVLGMFSAYRIWFKEHERGAQLEQQIIQLQPSLGTRAVALSEKILDFVYERSKTAPALHIGGLFRGGTDFMAELSEQNRAFEAVRTYDRESAEIYSYRFSNRVADLCLELKGAGFDVTPIETHADRLLIKDDPSHGRLSYQYAEEMKGLAREIIHLAQQTERNDRNSSST